MNVIIKKICNEEINEKYATEELIKEQFTFSSHVYRLKSLIKWDYWAIFDDNKPIGFFCGTNVNRNRIKEIAKIMACSILPEYRGKGIGSQAFGKMEEYYKELNCTHFYAIVDDYSSETDAPQKRFFKKLGFTEICTSYDFNDDTDEVFSIMVKSL